MRVLVSECNPVGENAHPLPHVWGEWRKGKRLPAGPGPIPVRLLETPLAVGRVHGLPAPYGGVWGPALRRRKARLSDAAGKTRLRNYIIQAVLGRDLFFFSFRTFFHNLGRGESTMLMFQIPGMGERKPPDCPIAAVSAPVN